MSLSGDWTTCSSRAIEAYRYLPEQGVLQIIYRQGRMVYDFPCDEAMFEGFLSAASKGRYAERVLRPHARRMGWSRKPYRFSG